MRCVICKRFCFLYFTSIPHPTNVAVSMLTTEIALSKVSNYPLLTIFSLLGLPVAFNVHKEPSSFEIFILFASVLPLIPTLCILWTLLLHHVLGWIVLFLISSFGWEFLWTATLLSLISLQIFVSGWYKVPQPPLLRNQSPPSLL